MMLTKKTSGHLARLGSALSLAVVAVLVPSLFCSTAFAQNSDSESTENQAFKLRGFGSIGLARTTTDDALYRADWRNPAGAGKSWDPSVDSKFGLMTDFDITQNFTATAQVVAAKNADASYRPKLDWLYLSYFATPDLSIRVGRTRLPTFVASDYYNVGQAYMWVRPPTDVYNQLSVFSVDGLDVVYEYRAESYSVLVQPVIGRSQFDVFLAQAGGRLQGDVTRIRGINLSLQKGPFSIRFGSMQSDLTMTKPPAALNTMVQGLREASVLIPAAADLANAIGIVNRRFKFTGVGASYEGNNVIFLSEYTRRRSTSILPYTTAWYVSAGLHLGAYTPYLTYSKILYDGSKTNSTVPPEGPFLPLSQAVNTLYSFGADSKTTAIGLRYEYSPKIMLKAQCEYISGGLDPLPGRPKPNNVGVLSAVVDFIF